MIKIRAVLVVLLCAATLSSSVNSTSVCTHDKLGLIMPDGGGEAQYSVRSPRQQLMPAYMVVHIIGTSITDGRYVPDGAYAWWRDGYFVRAKEKICGQYCGGQVVKNAHGGGCLVAVGCAGLPATDWVYTEVFNADPAPTTVILEMGVNDIGLVSDQQFFNAYASLYFSAHDHGIQWITGTIPPACSTMPGWAAREPQRKRVNAWIRNNLNAGVWSDGGVADFAAYMEDSNGGLKPMFSLANCTGNVNLTIHPGKYGAWEMSNAIPGNLIR